MEFLAHNDRLRQALAVAEDQIQDADTIQDLVYSIEPLGTLPLPLEYRTLPQYLGGIICSIHPGYVGYVWLTGEMPSTSTLVVAGSFLVSGLWMIYRGYKNGHIHRQPCSYRIG